MHLTELNVCVFFFFFWSYFGDNKKKKKSVAYTEVGGLFLLMRTIFVNLFFSSPLGRCVFFFSAEFKHISKHTNRKQLRYLRSSGERTRLLKFFKSNLRVCVMCEWVVTFCLLFVCCFYLWKWTYFFLIVTFPP